MLSCIGLAQQLAGFSKHIQPEFNLKYGILAPHSGAVKVLMGGPFPIYELGVGLPTIGSAKFNAYYPRHQWGVIFNFSPLSSPENLGFALGITPYIDISLSNKNRNAFYFRLGSGLAYIQKPFDIETNIKNQVIGTHFNNITDLQFKYKFHLSDYLEVRLGVGLQHFSNGSFTRPNLGLNIPHFTTGIKYHIVPIENKMQKDTIGKDTSSFYTNFSYGYKNLDFGSPKHYSVLNIGGGYSFSLRKNRWLYLHADVIYDESIPHLKNYDYELKNADSFIFGLFAIYEKKFGNIGLTFGSGYYLHSVYTTFDQDWSFKNKGGRFYNRVGVKAYLSNALYGMINIRSHTGEADNIEFGIGYRFRK